MLGKKNNGSSPPALPGAKAPSSMQRSITMDMPYMPDGGGGAYTPSVGGSGHGGEGSSYYARDGASSIHGETVGTSFNVYGKSNCVHKHERREERGAVGFMRAGCLELSSLGFASRLLFPDDLQKSQKSTFPTTRPPAVAPSLSSCSSRQSGTSSASNA